MTSTVPVPPRHRRPARRRVLLVARGLLAVVLVTAGWLGWRGLAAERHLSSAREGIAAVRAALAAGDVARARAAATELQEHTGSARRITSDPVWRATAALPVAGDNVEAVAEVADVADTLAADLVPDLLDAGAAFDPATLRPAGDRVDVAAVARIRPTLQRTSDRLAELRARVQRLGELHLLSPVSRAVDDLDGDLTTAHDAASGAATVADLLPPMLAADGKTRRYFLAFQNNAEARGTGGLLGAYGVLEARNGNLSLQQLGPNGELESADALPVNLGGDFADRYGDDPALWGNANMSPHFPYAARIWLALWQQQTGDRLDGVIATDPVALGYVLTATGPATLPDGSRLTGENAASLTMRDAYAKYPDPGQNPARDAYLQQVAGAAFDRVLSGSGSPHGMLDALTRAADERRLLVYSAHPTEQRTLADTVVGGTLTDRRGPNVAVVVNNGGGNKLDYYLDRTVRYQRLACDGDRQQSRLSITMANTAPRRGLPPYVQLRGDPVGADRPSFVGRNRVLASAFLPVGARVEAASLDGGPLRLVPGEERHRPTADFVLDIPPGQRRTVVLQLDEPATPGPGAIMTQPLVRPAAASVATSSDAARCGS